jgi:AmpE protein
MFVTLVAVIFALVLGHLAHAFAVALRQHGWFGQWMRWLDARFPGDGFWRGRFGIALALVPPLLVVLLFQLALRDSVYGLPAILFGVAVLFYTWGPSDLDLDVDAIVEARDPVERHAAASRLWPSGAQPRLDGPSLVGAVFGNAKRRWFGVLFWFLVLGPFGAVLYRLVAVAAEGNDTHLLPVEMVAGARGLLALLDWPVAQLMTLSMALVGNFDAVFAAWKENAGATFAPDGDFLAAAARACVRSELADDLDYTESGIAAPAATPAIAPELPELRDAMSLVWRILLVWLAVLALFVVAGWVS